MRKKKPNLTVTLLGHMGFLDLKGSFFDKCWKENSRLGFGCEENYPCRI